MTKTKTKEERKRTTTTKQNNSNSSKYSTNSFLGHETIRYFYGCVISSGCVFLKSGLIVFFFVQK